MPPCAADAFEAALQDALPHLFAGDPGLLHCLVTMLSPEELQRRGVPVFRRASLHDPRVLRFIPFSVMCRQCHLVSDWLLQRQRVPACSLLHFKVMQCDINQA